MRDPGTHGGLCHLALFYASQAEWRDALSRFALSALRRGEPVFAAVPGDRVRSLRTALGAAASAVPMVDMTDMGRNPARIIPVIRTFIDSHPGQRVSYIGEPSWPSRSGAELVAAAKHEALVNYAFDDSPVTILCLYDQTGLPAEALADAEHTHPILLREGESRPSAVYLGPDRLPPRCESPLPGPPAWARSLAYHDDLRPLRELVASEAIRAGLADDRVPDLVLAVSELAANTLQHTNGGGTLRAWHTPDEIICQVEDEGVIDSPLAGRVRPVGGEPGGHGLWLVNQVCDLVEMRSGEAGTCVRLQMRLKP